MINKSPVNLIPIEKQASRFPRARARGPLTNPLNDTRNQPAGSSGGTSAGVAASADAGTSAGTVSSGNDAASRERRANRYN